MEEDRRRKIKGASELEENRGKGERKSEGKQSISSHARPWTR